MSMWLRVTLIWLLALALPAQGLAAATMVFCQTGHAAPVATVSAPHCDEHAAPAQANPQVQADAHKCSACAACCSAGAVHSMVLQVPEPGITAPVFVAVVPTVEKFSASGPDRPPRAIRA